MYLVPWVEGTLPGELGSEFVKTHPVIPVMQGDDVSLFLPLLFGIRPCRHGNSSIRNDGFHDSARHNRCDGDLVREMYYCGCSAETHKQRG